RLLRAHPQWTPPDIFSSIHPAVRSSRLVSARDFPSPNDTCHRGRIARPPHQSQSRNPPPAGTRRVRSPRTKFRALLDCFEAPVPIHLRPRRQSTDSRARATRSPPPDESRRCLPASRAWCETPAASRENPETRSAFPHARRPTKYSPSAPEISASSRMYPPEISITEFPAMPQLRGQRHTTRRVSRSRRASIYPACHPIRSASGRSRFDPQHPAEDLPEIQGLPRSAQRATRPSRRSANRCRPATPPLHAFPSMLPKEPARRRSFHPLKSRSRSMSDSLANPESQAPARSRCASSKHLAHLRWPLQQNPPGHLSQLFFHPLVFHIFDRRFSIYPGQQ